eukprot:s57_g47.t1
MAWHLGILAVDDTGLRSAALGAAFGIFHLQRQINKHTFKVCAPTGPPGVAQCRDGFRSRVWSQSPSCCCGPRLQRTSAGRQKWTQEPCAVRDAEPVGDFMWGA